MLSDVLALCAVARGCSGDDSPFPPLIAATHREAVDLRLSLNSMLSSSSPILRKRRMRSDEIEHSSS